tara:strand:- start:18486 stop:19199 length:714 start_codon:yes stop_codon:yes gene_type:complete
MPTLYTTNTNKDGMVWIYAATDWDATRSAGSGGAYNSTSSAPGMIIDRFAGRGGYVTAIYRMMLWFDTSGISVAPASATLKIMPKTIFEAIDLIAVRRSGNGSFNLTGYSTMVGDGDSPTAATQLAATDGSGGGTLASVPGLAYSSNTGTSYSVDSYIDIPLNATALANMASLDDFSIMVMDYTYDYRDQEFPLTGTDAKYSFFYMGESATAKEPYIEFTAATTTVAENATFFGANF